MMMNYIDLTETTRTLSAGWCQVRLGPTICTEPMTVVARLARVNRKPVTLLLETEHGESFPVAPHDIRGLEPVGASH
jgi:hypothetical protein